MSLKVWLPLDGDTKNYGISNIDKDLSFKQLTQQTNGKIGKCYNKGNIYHLSKDIIDNQWTACFWFKQSQFGIYNDILLCKNTSSANDAQFYISSYGEGTKLNVRINSDTYVYCPYDFSIDTWYHVAVSYDGNTWIAYINGNVLQSGIVTAEKTNALNLGIGTRSNNDTGTVCSSTDPSKYLNDIRIYDECLSSKQIKEISKGLICHYKFDDPYIEGTTNLVPANIYNYTSVPNAYFSGIREITTFDGYKCFSVTTVVDSSHRDGFICQQTGNCVEGETYTYSGYAWIPTGYSWVFGERQINGGTAYVSMTIVGNNQWQYFNQTFTANDNTSGMIQGYEYEDYPTAHTIYIRDLQLEKKDHATPIAHGIRDVGQVKDVTGYGHNGIVYGNPEISTDTARYNRAIKIINTNDTASTNVSYIKSDLSLITPNVLTINWWGKVTSTGLQNSGMMSISSANPPTDYQTGLLNQYDSIFRFNNSAGTYKGLSSTNLIVTGAWHMYTLVYDGANVKSYRDGTLVQSLELTGPLASCSKLFLSLSVAGGAWRHPSGLWSDFRMYVTALSEDDIKQLYNTSAFIDNKNNMMAYEFVEE